MELKIVGNWYKREFETWGEMIDFAQGPDPKDGYHMTSSNNDHDDSWALGCKRDQAFKFAKEGWKDGVAKCEKLSEALVTKVCAKIERIEPFYDVCDGLAWDMAYVASGIPECALHVSREIVDGPGNKLVRLHYNAAASCGISGETLLTKGASVVALAQCLEAAGIQTEISVASMCGAKREFAYLSRAKVKRFGETFDISNLAFAVAHPATLRKIGFACIEHEGSTIHAKIGMCYGTPKPNPDAKLYDIEVGESMAGNTQWGSIDACEKWVLDNLKKQGIEIGG